LVNKLVITIRRADGTDATISISLWWVALALLVAVVLAWR
jgi:hypothetical protein